MPVWCYFCKKKHILFVVIHKIKRFHLTKHNPSLWLWLWF